MKVDTQSKSTRRHKTAYHKAYGIQKWLVGKGFCLSENGKQVNYKEYENLLSEFCLHIDSNFNFKGSNAGNMESFINNRFHLFSSFCMKKFSHKNENS